MAMIKFDHIEVHVKDAEKYSEFLKTVFGNGRAKKISENGTYMFVSVDDIHIEIKQNATYTRAVDIKNDIGFCLPCLRMKGAKAHLDSLQGIEITNQAQNPDGALYFFKDYEGVMWHIKDYEMQDATINI